MGKFFLGLIIVVISALVTIKSEWIYQNFGTIPSADKYLGSEGGGRLAWKLIGIAGCFIGFLIMTNLIEGVLLSFVKLFVPGVK